MKSLSIIFSLVCTGLILCTTGHLPEGDPANAIITALEGKNSLATDHFEKAVEIIKKYESLHSTRHWPFVGYGHKVVNGDNFSRKKALTESQADALLRSDLLKLCKFFRSYGADSLLMATLAYNIGPGAASRSSVAKKLKVGNRDIRTSYLAHSRYKGKTLSQLKRRRTEEFNTLFIDSIK